MEALFFAVLMIIGGVLYFLPTIIAAQRKHMNGGPIALVNIFFGWTLLGWFIALIWSATSNIEANQPTVYCVLPPQQVPPQQALPTPDASHFLRK